jgi:TadE-like protein
MLRRGGQGARDRTRAQALAEFAIVFPIAMLVIFGIIVLGLFVFYQQQITNVAREAARWAAIHSSTSPCPTIGWRDAQPAGVYPNPFACDGPANPNDTVPWPAMSAQARSNAWGMNASTVMINACWSGYLRPGMTPGGSTNADFPPVEDLGAGPVQNTFVQCTIDGIDPTTSQSSLGCRLRMTTAADDPASDKADGLVNNQVTVYACFQWTPPLAGLLMIPSSVTMQATITETIQRQQ